MQTRAITQFFVRQPMLFWSAVVAILLAGILSFMQMPKLEDPAVAVKQASVVVVYPGATAHKVELQVAQTMEEQLRTLPDVKEIRTECREGMALLTVEFEMTVLNTQIEQHFDLLRRKVGDAAMRLPTQCYAPIVVDDMMDVYGIFYALVCDPGFTYPEMERYAKLIRRELLKVPGVKRINVVGARPEVINIRLRKDQLSRNGLLPTQIMLHLQQAGKTVDGGRYEQDDERVSLHVTGALADEHDIADLLIKT
ncbi:MAG: efflux RND transporter permease subunit, partial [Prevotella sp.]